MLNYVWSNIVRPVVNFIKRMTAYGVAEATSVGDVVSRIQHQLQQCSPLDMAAACNKFINREISYINAGLVLMCFPFLFLMRHRAGFANDRRKSRESILLEFFAILGNTGFMIEAIAALYTEAIKRRDIHEKVIVSDGMFIFLTGTAVTFGILVSPIRIKAMKAIYRKCYGEDVTENSYGLRALNIPFEILNGFARGHDFVGMVQSIYLTGDERWAMSAQIQRASVGIAWGAIMGVKEGAYPSYLNEGSPESKVVQLVTTANSLLGVVFFNLANYRAARAAGSPHTPILIAWWGTVLATQVVGACCMPVQQPAVVEARGEEGLHIVAADVAPQQGGENAAARDEEGEAAGVGDAASIPAAGRMVVQQPVTQEDDERREELQTMDSVNAPLLGRSSPSSAACALFSSRENIEEGSRFTASAIR